MPYKHLLLAFACTFALVFTSTAQADILPPPEDADTADGGSGGDDGGCSVSAPGASQGAAALMFGTVGLALAFRRRD